MSTDKPAARRSASNDADFSNHLQQQFRQKAPNLVWVRDITYIKVNGKWYYLCIVMDLFSRKVIAWHISAKPDVDLVISTFNKAYQKRNAPSGLMFHSDRGSQYTAFAFRQLLDSLDVVQSFSKAGFPFDNACCECFFKYLKKEETTAEPTILYRSSSSLFLNILRASTIPDVLMAHLACLLLIRLNFCSPSMPRLRLTYFSHSSVHFFDYGPYA